jgi:hypothetical protein
MFWMKKKRTASPRLKGELEAGGELAPPTISITLSDVKKLVREFEQHLPKGINRTILIGQDNEMNFELLIPLLRGMPDQKFYMSRESFEIFTEEEKHIPMWLDIVQRAVDDYIADLKAAPTMPGDKRKKINYVMLQNQYYLKESPPLDFYLSDLEDMITHIPLE